MFENYSSIDDLMNSEAKYTIQQELNGNWLYVGAVRHCRFREIGIIVKDDLGYEIGRYASLNRPTGEIESIESHLSKPDITVRVQESVLLKILKNVDEIKAHPIRSFFHYAPRFRIKIADFLTMAGYVRSRSRRADAEISG
ncbi:MAG: hypothetical protein QT02_C0002G0013 [archaeon GW2011_AR9]|nr:MAG: hypothetical protein QT02_C0002G0013 [archaeon GW2011_AR9]MBS3120556.1 hypothetical protein [Candidatus Woesearchaeota archaeon]HIG93924.1 hypothetical protein [Candidatus Woesearchaeota archaeon]HIH13480.1 hypothetical protein [Candidatus Woesearchaeota archaeon]